MLNLRQNLFSMTAETSLSKEINQVKNILTEKFEAKQIFLFGSYAYGLPSTESDLDLCVILNLAGKRKIEWMREIRRELSDIVSKPLDILVYGNKEFEERANLDSTLEHLILTKGIILHGQPRHRTGVVQSLSIMEN